MCRGAYCPEHSTVRRRAAAWARVRRARLAVDPLCSACGAPASEVDHIVPLAAGGAELDPANLQPLCRRCHAAKTSAESG